MSSLKEDTQPRSDRFNWESGDIKLSLCIQCRHKLPGSICSAFDKIPRKYLDGSEEHRKLDGKEDNDFVFEDRNSE